MMDMDLQIAVAKIQQSKDAVAKMGELISASGGFWDSSNTTDSSKLFNIQLCGIQGMGIGASAAVDDWMSKAKTLTSPRRRDAGKSTKQQTLKG